MSHYNSMLNTQAIPINERLFEADHKDAAEKKKPAESKRTILPAEH